MRIQFMGVILWLTMAAGAAQAQIPDESAIEAVVRLMFTGMEKGDSAMVNSTFRSDVAFVTIYRDKQNNAHLEREPTSKEFLKAVGTPHAAVWNEDIWNLAIRIDGDFAQVWCDYAFYLGHTFSHCGVDAFQLYRESNGWKIFQLTDTRRRAPCEIPETIQAKHR